MSDEIVVKVDNVSKTFRLPHDKNDSIKGAVINFYKRKRTYEKQKAVEDVSFEIKKGEFFGIVGRNGSGKSTMLKMLAGIYSPSRGNIHVNGKLIPFIELGVGFNPDLTGRENVYLNGALLGFSRKETQAMYEDIVEFAELERFMDQKLKNYSSGMQVRLAFSIAIRAKGDILLLDEVLAVGDTLFQQKCFNHFYQLKKSNKTVLLVSHDTNVLRRHCTNGALLENGKLVSTGPIEDILEKYIDIVSEKEANEKPGKRTTSEGKHGTGKIQIKSLEVLDAKRASKKVFGDNDKHITIQLEAEAAENVETPVYGISIKDMEGSYIFGSNNLWKSIKAPNLSPGQTQKVSWVIPNIFNTGELLVSPAIADMNGNEVYDSRQDMASFKIRRKISSNPLISVDHEMNFEKPAK